MNTRLYKTQNPWITFHHATNFMPFWAHLGEAYSKCQHLTGTPLQPALATHLSGIYMRKGALATTAIEGNTLSEEEVEKIFVQGHNLPPSQAYLQQEIENVLHALRAIDKNPQRQSFTLTPQWLMNANKAILANLDVADHVTPGEYTRTQLVVGNSYKAAPPEDVPYLIDRLCTWLNTDYLQVINNPETSEDMRFYSAFLASTLAHLYIAWIHPFGDGNGRTARLVQVAILASSGVVPWVSTNLLSDFYNRTRTEYYRRLEATSKAGDVTGFLTYSAQGFVDLLREQIDTVQAEQRKIAWVTFVHEVMHDEPSGKVKDRRRDLALSMPETPLTRRELMRLTPELAMAYAGTERTISRDLGVLRALGLVRAVDRGRWIANVGKIDAFKPR